MNHERIYAALIAKRRANPPSGYCERHHAIPKCLGGSDAPENIVLLTGREHFVAHWLLARIHGGRLWMAVLWMKGRRFGDRYINSRAYDAARQRWAQWSAQNQRGPNHWAHGKPSPYKGKRRPEMSGPNHWNFGRKRTPAQTAAVIAANRGKKRSEEVKKKIGDAQRGPKNHMYGKHLSDEAKARISASLSGRRFTAEHRARISASNKGRTFSEESRAKMSASQKARAAREKFE